MSRLLPQDSSRRPLADASPLTALRRRAKAGFSLIEVLAAVAILGIWFSMLATLAMDGLRTTGESQRRLRASVLADQVLAEFELKAILGEPLDDGASEREDQDPFTISVELRDLSAGTQHVDTSPDTLDLIGFFHQQNDSIYSEVRQGNWLLEYLREVRIQIKWEEGINEITITRTAYFWDKAAWEDRESNAEVPSTGDPDLDAFIQGAMDAER